MTAITALWKRELIKFSRDRSRLFGALLQPLAFWILLGLGFSRTFQIPAQTASDISYLEFLFPGIIALILLFTAIFSTISIVEERTSGFIQAALVAPASRTSLVLGNLLGGTTFAILQALLFSLLLPVVGIIPEARGIALVILIGTLTALAFTGLGFVIAWRMESTRGFHAVMNLFLLPLWFLSGAPFPMQGASPLLQWIMHLNPVSYAVDGLRSALYLPEASPLQIAPIWLCVLVTAAFAAAMVGMAVATVRRRKF